MKKLLIVISVVCLGTFGFSNTAFAEKDPKTIRHCGCVFEEFGVSGQDMAYHDVDVAGKSKGHKPPKHIALTTSDCWDGDAGTNLFVRTMDDCEVTDVDADIPNCSGESIGDICGAIVP